MSRKYLIAPSILSADFSRLGDEVRDVLKAGADVIHVDVMDNHYVPNLTIGPLVVKALRKCGIDAPLDCHLMTSPVDSLVEMFAEAGASYITFHAGASAPPDRTLSLIKSFGLKCGLVLNPATSPEWLRYEMERLDIIMLMSVNPGFGGQSFIPGTLQKLREVRKMIDDSGRDIRLEVDGGVKTANIREIAEAGADMFVAGSAIFGADDYGRVISEMRARLGGEI